MIKKVKRNRKRIIASILDYNKGMRGAHIAAFASQTAFFILLAFFPIVNILLYSTTYLPFSRGEIVDFVTNLVPQEFNAFFKSMINSLYVNKMSSFTIVSVIIAIWSASKAIMAIRNALNEINNSREDRNYFIIRGISAIYTAVFIVILVLLLVLKVFGNKLAVFIADKFPESTNMLTLIINVRYAVMYGLLFLFLWALMTKLPARRLSFKSQIPGAIFSTIAWACITELFSLYYESPFADSLMYGSLTTMVFVMFWLYFGVLFIFIGEQINRYLIVTHNFKDVMSDETEEDNIDKIDKIEVNEIIDENVTDEAIAEGSLSE